jgi:hypothetical protein
MLGERRRHVVYKFPLSVSALESMTAKQMKRSSEESRIFTGIWEIWWCVMRSAHPKLMVSQEELPSSTALGMDERKFVEEGACLSKGFIRRRLLVAQCCTDVDVQGRSKHSEFVQLERRRRMETPKSQTSHERLARKDL